MAMWIWGGKCICRCQKDFQYSCAARKRAPDGAQNFGTILCGVCHAVNGVSSGRLGPELTHVASRQTLAAGRLVNNPVNLEVWIADPDKHKPGSSMPNAALSEPDLSALVTYRQIGRAERCWTACRVNQSRKSMTAPSRRSRKPANWPKAGEVTLLYTSCQL